MACQAEDRRSAGREGRDQGQYYRRMRTRLGAAKAITAAAHKLARIVFHLLTTKHPYDESAFTQQELQNHQRIQQKLRQQAQKYGFQLVPTTVT